MTDNEQRADSSPNCPYRTRHDQRKSAATAGSNVSTWIERTSDNVFKIGSFELARQILRGGGVRQAGFNAELVERFTAPEHTSVLYQEGSPIRNNAVRRRVFSLRRRWLRVIVTLRLS